MATSGFSVVCSVAAGQAVYCPLTLPPGATSALGETCFGSACLVSGPYLVGAPLLCEGVNAAAGGAAQAAVCGVQYLGPLLAGPTVAETVQLSWAIVLCWAVVWGVRRLMGYALDAQNV